MAAVMPNEKSPIRKSGGKIRLSKQHEIDEDITSLKTKLRLKDSSEKLVNEPEHKTDTPLQIEERSKKCKYKTLVRSHALCGDDDTRLSARRDEKQSSSNSSSGISRDSSSELYTDSTGINLEEFIIATLHKNAKDRQMILNLEEELIAFVQDTSKQVHRFPPMSSYNRMLVHRIGAFFGLDHNVDQSGTAVVVNKTKSVRLPAVQFKNYIRHDFFTEEPKHRVLLRRDAQSFDEDRMHETSTDVHKTRSFEEREEDYVRARARIFNQDSNSSTEGLFESRGIDSYLRPWSSADSGCDVAWPQLTQQSVPSHFLPKVAAVPAMPTAAVASTCSVAANPTFCRKEPVAKTQIRRSRTENDGAEGHVFPPVLRSNSVNDPVSMPSDCRIAGLTAGQPVIFAVANIEQVPFGAIIINPQTGQPYLNQDGTVYRHNPALLHFGQGLPCQPAAAAAAPCPVVPCVQSSGAQDGALYLGAVQPLTQHHSDVANTADGPRLATSSNSFPGLPQVYAYVMLQPQGNTYSWQQLSSSQINDTLTPNCGLCHTAGQPMHCVTSSRQVISISNRLIPPLPPPDSSQLNQPSGSPLVYPFYCPVYLNLQQNGQTTIPVAINSTLQVAVGKTDSSFCSAVDCHPEDVSTSTGGACEDGGAATICKGIVKASSEV